MESATAASNRSPRPTRGTARAACSRSFSTASASPFPELKIIGAHLGYGLYDSAAAVARWRRNVYFDISGGTVVRRHLIERNMLRSEVSTLKLAWGSDCDMAHMSRELTQLDAGVQRARPVARRNRTRFSGAPPRTFSASRIDVDHHAPDARGRSGSAPTLWFAAARADRAMHPGFQHRRDDGAGAALAVHPRRRGPSSIPVAGRLRGQWGAQPGSGAA